MYKIKNFKKTKVLFVAICILMISPSLPTFFLNSNKESNTIDQGLHTSALTEILRPMADSGNNQWLYYPLPHWSRLNEAVINPNPGDTTGIYAGAQQGDDNKIEEFLMTDTTLGPNEVLKIEVHTYGKSFGTNPKVRIFWGGSWTARQVVNLPRTSGPWPVPPLNPGWATNTWELEGDEADVNNIRVEYLSDCHGYIFIPPYFSINIGNNHIYTSYCEITYKEVSPDEITILSPRANEDYTEYVMLDIASDGLTQLEYKLNSEDWKSISGDIALHIPEGSHSLQVKGYSGSTPYSSDIVNFNTWDVSVSTEQGLDWGADLINAEECWDTSRGTNIKVLVIDSGMDLDHSDLADIEQGKDFEDADNSPDDVNGHGTNCAGIIGAIDNNVGVIGASPEVSLYIARIHFLSDMTFIGHLGAAIQWGIDKDVDVISMSLGYFTDEIFNYISLGDEVEDKCQAAYQAGITLCASAGNWNNWGDEITDIHYPAAYSDHVIPVGALYYDLTLVGTTSNNDWDPNPADQWYAGSCYGYDQNQGVVAAGTQITSTDLDNGYYTGNGTSYACPLVAGVCALILAASSEIYQMTENTRADAVRECIYNSAIDLGDTGWDEYYGNGMVDAVGAIDYALTNNW